MNKLLCGMVLFISVLLSGCGSGDIKTAQGYVEGLLTYVSSSTSGFLDTVLVVRGSAVSAGTPLFVLNPQPENHAYQAAVDALAQAKANREDIVAKLQFAAVTLKRNEILYQKRVLEKSAFDRARSDFDSFMAQKIEAEAAIQEKSAQLASSAWTLSQKNIHSMKQGIVYDVYYRTGEYIDVNQPVLSILSPTDIKIIFYVAQPMLSVLRLGGRIQAACDGCDWVTGQVTFISNQAEYTPPLIFSNDTNSKLVYRIEAQFDKNKHITLHPGQPVTVKYGFNK